MPVSPAYNCRRSTNFSTMGWSMNSLLLRKPSRVCLDQCEIALELRSNDLNYLIKQQKHLLKHGSFFSTVNCVRHAVSVSIVFSLVVNLV